VILAIVGTRKFSNPRALAYAELIIQHEVRNRRWDKFITGDAEGIDALCQQWCAVEDRWCDALSPEKRQWKPDGFEARNILIARRCDELLCIRDPLSKTYGSGWTADYAEQIGKPVTRVEIS
jgi:predicted Rossmann fold nucleotide-binding protein DprA/Smf involved in DNA uptake